MQKEYITIKQIAELAKLSRQAIDKRISVRKIEIEKIGHLKVIRRQNLEAVLAK